MLLERKGKDFLFGLIILFGIPYVELTHGSPYITRSVSPLNYPNKIGVNVGTEKFYLCTSVFVSNYVWFPH